MQALQESVSQILTAIEQYTINSTETLEQYRIEFLGTKGRIKEVMGAMKDVATADKKEAGLLLNSLRQKAEEKFEANKAQFEVNGGAKTVEDYTLPGHSFLLGSRHPLSLVRNKIVSIFSRLGFAVAEGPEIEDDWHNFSALNLPEDHPARDMQDTFYLNDDGTEGSASWLLRTHTSSVQVREMEKGNLPIRIICPGRVYRNETISARAHCFFHQVEGLYIDEHVSFADLKQTLYFFVQEMFGKEVKVRFRPSYFPFTEPSAEMDVSCFICGGETGCNVCKHTGWVEILGCGMVHPKLLENCGIDSNKYTGFAFGMGIERITMLKYQIKDLRLFSENDLRFLNQFRSAL
jgi:phenylalanyl-tRNA synthetase alpha chain